jgi:hypothetical protein
MHLKIEKTCLKSTSWSRREHQMLRMERGSSIQRQKRVTTRLGQKWNHCVGEDKLMKKTYVKSKINSGGRS